MNENLSVINDVMITIGDDGVMHFTPKTSNHTEQTLWNKIKGWLSFHNVRPAVNVRDLADPTGDRAHNLDDRDVGSDGKLAIEAGIKIDF